MTSTFIAFFALFSGTSLFVTGVGLLSTALALRATVLGFSDALTGTIMGAYFLGFVVGTQVGPKIVIRVGHVRAFSAFAAAAAAALLLHPLWPNAGAWALLRFTTGMCVVGLYMVIESWLNERSTNATRGRAFALYQIISLGSLGLGQYLILFGGATSAAPFLIAGALFSLGLVPVVLTRVTEPAPISAVKLDLQGLWRISPLGVAGTLVSALGNGSFIALGPVFAQRIGLSTVEISLFMSLLLFGGVALQWPIGHLSDRWDRRTVILLVCIAGAVLSGLAWSLTAQYQTLLFGVVFIYGGITSSLYSLCVAHSNDYVPAQNSVATASGLLLVYGIGATIGPPVVGAAMQVTGAAAFWLFLLATFAALAVFVLVRMRLRTEQPTQEPFVMLTRTSQAALEALAAERKLGSDPS